MSDVSCALFNKTFSSHIMSLLGVPALSTFCSTPPPSWTPSPETLAGIRSNTCENAQTGHYVYVDNIGVVSDQFSQVHVAVDESEQDFEGPSYATRDLGEI